MAALCIHTMKCNKCQAEFKVTSPEDVTCIECGVVNEVHMSEFSSNVPEYKINYYLIYFSVILGVSLSIYIWPQQDRSHLIAPAVMPVLIAQLIVALRSGYFPTMVGVFFKENLSLKYWLCVFLNSLFIIALFPISYMVVANA